MTGEVRVIRHMAARTSPPTSVASLPYFNALFC